MSVVNSVHGASSNHKMSLLTAPTETKHPDADFNGKRSFMTHQRGKSRSSASNSSSVYNGHRAQSISGLGQNVSNLKQPQPSPERLVENSYQMGPVTGEKPLTSVVQNGVSDIINSHLEDISYCQESSGKLACELAALIKQRVKRCLPCARYKVTCNVLVSPTAGQGLHTVSRCAWNPETDCYTSVTYNKNGMNIVALVHWVYFE